MGRLRHFIKLRKLIITETLCLWTILLLTSACKKESYHTSDLNKVYISKSAQSDSVINILRNGFILKKHKTLDSLLSSLEKADVTSLSEMDFKPLNPLEHALSIKDAEYYFLGNRDHGRRFQLVLVHEYKFIDPGQLFIYLVDKEYKSHPQMIGYFLSDGEVVLQYTKHLVRRDSISMYLITRQANFPDMTKISIDSILIMTKIIK